MDLYPRCVWIANGNTILRKLVDGQQERHFYELCYNPLRKSQPLFVSQNIQLDVACQNRLLQITNHP
nr:MAG TPA: hypothetical protein [Caudoviricetes sp.]